MKTIYFDHAATTPVDLRVLQAMLPYFSECYGNPSELHRLGREARAAVEEARAKVAAALGAGEKEIVFTSGGTEADNLALFGYLARFQPGHLIVSAIEHPAIMETARALNRLGWAVDFVPVDGEGVVDIDAYEQAFRDDTRLASIMFANNVVGTVQPVARACAHRPREGRRLPHRRRPGGRVAAGRRRRAGRRHAQPLRSQAVRAEGRRRAVRQARHAPAAGPPRRRSRAPPALGHRERARHRRARRGHHAGDREPRGGTPAPRGAARQDGGRASWSSSRRSRTSAILRLGCPATWPSACATWRASPCSCSSTPRASWCRAVRPAPRARWSRRTWCWLWA